MFLTKEELKTLTGYKRPAEQIGWLRLHGLRCWRNARGQVVVPRSEVEARGQRSKPFTPDFSSLGS